MKTKDRISIGYLGTLVVLILAAMTMMMNSANAGDYRHHQRGHYGHHGYGDRTVIVKRGGISAGEAAAIGLGAFALGAIMSQQQQPVYAAPHPYPHPGVTLPPSYPHAGYPSPPIYIQPQVTVVPNDCRRYLPNMDVVDACISGTQQRVAQEGYQRWEEGQRRQIHMEQKASLHRERARLCGQFGGHYCN